MTYAQLLDAVTQAKDWQEAWEDAKEKLNSAERGYRHDAAQQEALMRAYEALLSQDIE